MFEFSFTSEHSHLLSIAKIYDLASLVSKSQLGMAFFKI